MRRTAHRSLKSPVRRVDTGFSLVELMIVMAILGLLTIVSVPAVMGWLPNQRCKAAAREIFASFQNAKTNAIKTNINTAITFNQPIGGSTYDYVVYTDQNANCEYDAGEPIITRVNLRSYPGVQFDLVAAPPDGLTFLNNDVGLPTIAFQPNSIPTDNNGGLAMGTAFIRNQQGLNYRISVSVAGNVAIDNL